MERCRWGEEGKGRVGELGIRGRNVDTDRKFE
jgi:hypothetical protein